MGTLWSWLSTYSPVSERKGAVRVCMYAHMWKEPFWADHRRYLILEVRKGPLAGEQGQANRNGIAAGPCRRTG